MKIAVKGPIGVGKSIFCKKIKTFFPTFKVYIEPSFENPFIEKYYENPKDICYDIDKYLIKHRIEVDKKANEDIKNGYIVILDTSIFSSYYYIYSNYKYEKNLTKKQYKELKQMIDEYIKNMKHKPNLEIELHCSEKTCFSRIRLRNAENNNLECENKIPLLYLKNQIKAIKHLTKKIEIYGIKTKCIDWENFDHGNNNKMYYKTILGIK